MPSYNSDWATAFLALIDVFNVYDVCRMHMVCQLCDETVLNEIIKRFCAVSLNEAVTCTCSGLVLQNVELRLSEINQFFIGEDLKVRNFSLRIEAVLLIIIESEHWISRAVALIQTEMDPIKNNMLNHFSSLYNCCRLFIMFSTFFAIASTYDVRMRS